VSQGSDSPRAPTAGAPAFSMREARSLLADEDLRPNLRHYWVDMLASWAGLIAGIQLMQVPALPWWARGLAFAAAVVLGYRAALFIHELAHQPDEEFGRFRLAWNLLIGIPFLMPTFVYQTHLDHHRRRHYGTSHDGEYLPFGSRPAWHLIGYLAESFVIPLLAIFRFGVLTPLTWLGKPVRDWVHRHASSMIIDPAYVRPLPSDKQLRSIRLQEAACFLFLLGAGTVIVGSWLGYFRWLVDPWLLPQVYAVAVTIILVNAVRTLGAHRYYYDRRAEDDRPMTFTEQLLDSINYPNRPWLTTLWAPVGLKYHGLHHLFPSLPYHAMPRVHRRLMEGLPADSPYRQTVSPSLTAALADLWKRARESQRTQSAGAGSAGSRSEQPADSPGKTAPGARAPGSGVSGGSGGSGPHFGQGRGQGAASSRSNTRQAL